MRRQKARFISFIYSINLYYILCGRSLLSVLVPTEYEPVRYKRICLWKRVYKNCNTILHQLTESICWSYFEGYCVQGLLKDKLTDNVLFGSHIMVCIVCEPKSTKYSFALNESVSLCDRHIFLWEALINHVLLYLYEVVSPYHFVWGERRPGSRLSAPRDRSSSIVEVSLGIWEDEIDQGFLSLSVTWAS